MGSILDDDLGGGPSRSLDDDLGGGRRGKGKEKESRGRGQDDRRRGKKQTNFSFILLSAIFGLIAGIAGLFVYGSLPEKMYGPIVIALTMLAFYAVFGLLVFLYSNISGVYTSRTGGANAFLPFLAVCAVVLIGGFIFEFIYELGADYKVSGPTSYTFLIDDSGSMEANDPNIDRYAAIEKILKDKDSDFPYAVYSFSNEVVCLREMAPKGETVGAYTTPDGQWGGTGIKNVLEKTVEAFENGSINDDKNPKVLLLSDGYATDIHFFTRTKPILKNFLKNHASISTVGLGSNVDEGLMKKIAEGTGGIYLNVSDADQLADAMEKAMSSYSSRDLLTVRNVPKLDFLYFLERVLFMGLLGLAIGISMIYVAGLEHDSDLILITSIVKGFLASLLLEVLLGTFNMSQKVVNLLYFVIVAVIISTTFVREKGSRYSGSGNADNVSYVPKRGAANDFGAEEKKRKSGPAKGFGDDL